MKIFLIALTLISVVVLWMVFPLAESSEKSSQKRQSITEDFSRRSQQRTSENKDNLLLDPDFDYEKAVELIFRDEDPFPNEKLTPKIFSDQYKKILADDNLLPRDRNTKLQLLVKAYVIKNGIESSLEGINQYFGEGMIRAGIMGHLFRYAQSDQGTLYRLIPGLGEGAEQEFAFTGIVSRIPSEGFIDASLFELFPLPDSMARTFSDHFVPLVMSNEISIEQGIELMTKAHGREVNQERLTNYLRRLLESDSDRIIKYCLSELDQKNVRDTILKAYLSREIVRSPERGISELLKMSQSHPEAVGAEFFAHTMAGFLKADREQALQWFADVSNGLAPDQQNSIQGAIALNLLERGEIETAWNRLKRISDPEVRANIERRLWAQESKLVSQSSSRNPKRFVEDIVSGESPHADFWLKRGFSKWYQADAVEANSWYSENRSRLKPSQSQHVARAYAEVALSEGDINLARQWAEQVIDPNFKQQLVEQIDVAAGQRE